MHLKNVYPRKLLEKHLSYKISTETYIVGNFYRHVYPRKRLEKSLS